MRGERLFAAPGGARLRVARPQEHDVVAASRHMLGDRAPVWPLLVFVSTRTAVDWLRRSAARHEDPKAPGRAGERCLDGGDEGGRLGHAPLA